MEVVFNGGRRPSFQDFPYCFELYYSRPKTVRMQVFAPLIIFQAGSCYFQLMRSSSIVDIFHAGYLSSFQNFCYCFVF